MPEDVAKYLASRARTIHTFSPVAQNEEWESFCRAQGWPVFQFAGLTEPGRCLTEPELAIMLRLGAGARVRWHETLHAWIADNAAHGIEYAWPEWDEEDAEETANRFSLLMAG